MSFLGPIPITPEQGGTGVENANTSTLTMGGAVTFSGAFTSTFTLTGPTTLTFPTSGTIATTAGTAASFITDSGTATPSTGSITFTGSPTGLTFAGSGSTVSLTGTLAVPHGGTGDTSFVAYSLLCGGTTSTGALQSVVSVGTAGQILTSNGAGALPTFQTSAGTTITLTGDTGGPLTSGSFTLTGGTSGLTFAGLGTTLTLGGTLTLADGGTNANLTASNGGIFYSTATAGAILAGTATANQVLMSGSSTAPTWSTAVYPATTTINQILYSSAANTITGLATANNAVLTTGATGTPVMTALALDGQLIIGSSAGAPIAATLTAGTGISIVNGHNSITLSASSAVAESFLTDSGSATPAAGVLTITGSATGLTFSGAGSTVSLGGTLSVPNGGTGDTSFVAYSLVCGGTTSTGSLQSVASVGTAGQILTSNGAAALPSFQTAPATSITITGDSGGPISSGSFTLTGGTSGLTFAGSGTTFTLGGVLKLAEGGTNANLTASNGGIFYSTATAGAILAGTATANQVLMSGSSAAPSWSTAVYPATTTINQILYSSSANTVTGLSTANSGVLTTGATGVPVVTALASDGQLIIGSSAGAPAAATLTAGSNISITNGHNSITISTTGAAADSFLTDSGSAVPAAGVLTITGSSTGLTFSGSGSTVTLSGTLGVPNGGTGDSSFTPYSVLCGGLTSTGALQNVSGVGTAGQILTSNDAGALPTWQAPAASSITLTGDSGGGLTSSSFTITGDTTGLTFAGAGTTLTLGGMVSLAHGGTNASLTASNGGIFYSTASAGAILAGTATAGQMLRSGATGAPTWSTATWPATTVASAILYSSATNVVGGITPVINGTLITNNLGVPSMTTLGAGQVLIGAAAGVPVAATLTAGTGITVTNGNNTITIASQYDFPYTVQTAGLTMVKNNGYFSNSASTLTFLLPTTAAVGDTYFVAAMSSGFFGITQNTGQTIKFNSSTTTTTTGSIVLTSTGGTITIVCNVANTGFQVINSMGEFTVN